MTGGQHRMPASIRRPPPPDRCNRGAPWIAAGAGITFALGLYGASVPHIRPTVDVTAEREPVAVQTWTPRALPVVTVAMRTDTLSAATPSTVPPVHTRRPTTAARPPQTRTAASVATVAPTIATTPATTTSAATYTGPTTSAWTPPVSPEPTSAPTTTATTEPTLLPTPTDVLPTELPVETTSEETP